jgi:predicted TIM-barrel fold metal-dependent hydrolase
MTMPVVDVDCHFEIEIDPAAHPLRKFADRIPDTDQFVTDAITGDLRRVTPERSRPPADVLATMVPDANRSASEQATGAGTPPRFDSPLPSARLAWMDSVGIDIAFVNPGNPSFLLDYMGEDRPEACRLLNDFIADRLEGHTDRLMPAALVDYRDLDTAVAEMTRMRGRGSRTFWVRAEPVNGMSPAHPEWDSVWSAATDLGMAAVLHIGNSPAPYHGGWGNAGWELPGGTGTGGFFRYANCLRHQAAEMMLAGMIYGGVFGRHPNLTIVLEELQVSWLAVFVERCASLALAGDWPFDARPEEMARHNIRTSPLMGLGDVDLDTWFERIPELLVFSSDFPHGEGNRAPIELLRPALDLLEPERKASFLGGNIAECFARTGDPLPV